MKERDSQDVPWMRYGSRIAKSTLLLWIVLQSGCNGRMASVSGAVTLDGKPIAGGPKTYGTVSYYRADGGGAPAIGIIDSSGRYELKTGATTGLEPGKYLVGIAVKDVIPAASATDMPQAHLITPAKYSQIGQSGLEAEVKPGSNTFDFQLTSK